jgi:hypothetical protein
LQQILINLFKIAPIPACLKEMVPLTG